MTTHRSVRKRAQRLHRLTGVAALPGVATLLVAVAGAWSGSNNPMVAWCTDYWWQLLLGSGIAYLLARSWATFAIRCPACLGRLASFGVGLMPLSLGRVAFCPGCGKNIV